MYVWIDTNYVLMTLRAERVSCRMNRGQLHHQSISLKAIAFALLAQLAASSPLLPPPLAAAAPLPSSVAPFIASAATVATACTI